MNTAASTLQAILLHKKNHMYHHLKLLNLVFYEMTTMLFMNLIGRVILNIWNDEKDAGNSRAFGPSKFGPTLSTSTEIEDICTIFSAPFNKILNLYKLSASITILAKILKQGRGRKSDRKGIRLFGDG